MTKIKNKITKKVKEGSKKKRSRTKVKVNIPLNTEGLAPVLLTPKEIDLIKDLVAYRIIDIKEDTIVLDEGDEWKDPLLFNHIKTKISELNNIYSKLIFEK